jgi:hypothetical protein
VDEAVIQARINALSAGAFQRLAEAYAELTWPERYRHLVPQGRNAQDATTNGWPDAWAPDGHGRVHAVEATRDLNWSAHLEADVENAKAPPNGGQLASFVFVSRKDPRPKEDALSPYRQSLAALGLATDRIDFVFMDTLRLALAKPPFARVRADLLNLPSTTLPLRPILNARGIYGDGSASAFRPSRQEYTRRRVHRNSQLDAVRARLDAEGWAFVRGKGASGKTALCTVLAHDHASALLPALYLDLTDLDEPEINAADEQMHLHGGADVLFVVDNIHLAPEHAGHIFDHWRQREDGSRLLLTGRHTSPDPYDGYGSTIPDLDSDAIDIEGDIADVRGIYRRLALRTGHDPPEPPGPACRRWLGLFGGDLVAFSSAVVRRGAEALAGDWELKPSDAVDHVRRAYLSPLDDSALPSLLRVAVLSTFETPCPEHLVDVDELDPLLESGLLVRIGGSAALQAVHPGVGQLILAAAGSDADQALLTLLKGIAALDPSVAARVAQRMPSKVGLSLWQAIVESDASALVRAGLTGFAWTARMLTEGGHVAAAELDARLAGDEDVWADAVPRAGLRGLAQTLGMTHSCLPATSTVLRAQLTADGKPAEWLRDRLLAGDDWGATAGFIRQTGSVWPTMATTLDEELGDDLGLRLATALLAGGTAASTIRALRALIDEWPQAAHACLEHLASASPDQWRAAVGRSAVDDVGRTAVLLAGTAAEPAFQTSVDDSAFAASVVDRHLDHKPRRLTDALRTLERLSPSAHEEALGLVATPESGRRWATAAFRHELTDLGQIVGRPPIDGFTDAVSAYLSELGDDALAELLVATPPIAVRRVTRPGGQLAERLTELMARPDVAERHARTIVGCSPREAGAFLSASWVSKPVAALIASEAWAGGRPMRELSRQPATMPRLVAGLSLAGRADLAREVAVTFGESTIEGKVVAGDVPLGALSHLLRLTARKGDDWRAAVVDAVWSDGWMAARLARERPSELAQALFSLWHYYPPAAERVDLDALTELTATTFRSARTVGLLYDALELVGAATLYGMPASALRGQRQISFDVLDRMLYGLKAMTEPVSPQEVQLWLGFAALADGDGVELPLDGAERVIQRLGAQRLVTDRHRATADRVVAWIDGQLSP